MTRSGVTRTSSSPGTPVALPELPSAFGAHVATPDQRREAHHLVELLAQLRPSPDVHE